MIVTLTEKFNDDEHADKYYDKFLRPAFLGQCQIKFEIKMVDATTALENTLGLLIQEFGYDSVFGFNYKRISFDIDMFNSCVLSELLDDYSEMYPTSSVLKVNFRKDDKE